MPRAWRKENVPMTGGDKHSNESIRHLLQKELILGCQNFVWMDHDLVLSQSSKRSKFANRSPFEVETESRGNNKVDVLIIDDDNDDNSEEHSEEQLFSPNRDNHGRSNHEQHDVEQIEKRELESIKGQEAIPTNKAAFKNHPLYVIPSIMKKQEVLAPDAKKRICGIFKGEMVYRRSDVSMAFPAK